VIKVVKFEVVWWFCLFQNVVWVLLWSTGLYYFWVHFLYF